MKSLIIIMIFSFILIVSAQDKIIPIEAGNVWNFTGLYINDTFNIQVNISKIQIVEKDTLLSNNLWYKILNIDIRDTISTKTYEYWYADSMKFYATNTPEFDFALAITKYDSYIFKDSLIREEFNRQDWIIPSDSTVFETVKNVQKRLHYERARGHGVFWQWYHLTALNFGPIAYSDERGEDQDRWQIDSLYITGTKIGNEYFGRPSPPVEVKYMSNDVPILSWNKNIEENIIKYRIYSGKYRDNLSLIDSTAYGHDTSIAISNSNIINSYYRVTAVNNLYLESDYSVRVTVLGDTINTVSSRYSRDEEYALYPNYPNPFNHSTIIQFKVPKFIQVDLKLYDITGKLVSVLKNDKYNAGLYKFSFKRNDLASGLYFLQMKTPHFIRTRKLLIIN